MRWVFAILCGAGFGLPELAHATSQIVRVDGSIFDAAGAAVTANKDIQIKAYDAASGGSLLGHFKIPAPKPRGLACASIHHHVTIY